MKGRVIVVGGDERRYLTIKRHLEPNGVETVYCQEQSLCVTINSQPDILALIVLFPDTTGIVSQICSKSTANLSKIEKPVILISPSKDGIEMARASGYNADEILIEPVSPIELVNIIGAFIDKGTDRTDTHFVKVGELALDRVSYNVTLSNVPLLIFREDARVLEFLMLRPGRVFTRRQILNGIRGMNNTIDERTIDVYIGRIRDSMKHKVLISPIRTVRNVGYAFNERFIDESTRERRSKAKLRARHNKSRVG